MSIQAPEIKPPSADTLAKFAAIVGEKYALTGDDDTHPYVTEWRDKFFGKAAMVLRPGSVEEVSAIAKLAHETDAVLVPQSGNTGLVGGQIPFGSGNEIVLSLSRLNKVRNIDALDNTITVEAGCILENVQNAAVDVNRLFPLRIGSQGSCQIGGNLGANAGGIATLAYGNARDLVLGIEVVLADGRIWNGLNRLRKNNTGYDLKNLFIGSEGTLGIITAASLKLYPLPRDWQTALVGLNGPDEALALLATARDLVGNGVVGFEFMPRFAIEMAVAHTDFTDPMEAEHPWYVLFEIAGGSGPDALQPVMMEILETGFESGAVNDAAPASSQAQADRLWLMREQLTEVQKFEGGSIKHDVSVPVSSVPELISRGMKAIDNVLPGCRHLPYGHAGDGNIHFNISQPVGMDKDAFLAMWDDLSWPIHEITLDLGGSISAEHGIGRLKRDLMTKVKSDVDLDLMRGIKKLLDPKDVLNPGKVLPLA